MLSHKNSTHNHIAGLIRSADGFKFYTCRRWSNQGICIIKLMMSYGSYTLVLTKALMRTNDWYWLRLSSPFPFLCLASAYLSNWQLHPEWVYVMIASKVSFIPMTDHPFNYIAADKGLIRCSPWRHTWRFASCLLYCPATINMGVREIREDFGCRLLCRHTHRRLR